MNWPSVTAFLEMGGYAGYVWGSFAVAALALAGEVALVAQRRRAIVRALRRGAAARRLDGESA